jgi:hypothetical protein
MPPVGLDDVPARLQERVDHLVHLAKLELEALGVDMSGKQPRQILMMAQTARRQARVPPKRSGSPSDGELDPSPLG